MKVDETFLTLVQEAGWLVRSSGPHVCVGQCPSEGCGLTVKLVPGNAVPVRLPRDKTGTVVKSRAQWVALCEQRRKDLGLTRDEVEHVAGLADGHLGKIEDGTRDPLTEVMLALNATLGLEVEIRPSSLPPQSIRMLASTRRRDPIRQKLFGKGRRVLREPEGVMAADDFLGLLTKNFRARTKRGYNHMAAADALGISPTQVIAMASGFDRSGRRAFVTRAAELSILAWNAGIRPRAERQTALLK